MENRRPKILLILTVFYFFAPFLVQAGILPCGPFTQKPNCEPCDLLVLFVNVVEFLLFRLIPVLAAVVLGFGAFTFLIGLLQKSSEAVNKGKKWLLSVLIGLVIIYGGWLLVDIFLRLMGFTQERWPGLRGAWWRIDIQCGVQREPPIAGQPTPSEPLEPIELPTSSGPTGSKGIEDEEEEKCVKITGKNDSRRIVLIPYNGSEILGIKTCEMKWSKEDLKNKWIEVANRFTDALQEKFDPFTEDNFSIYRYDEISEGPISPCSAFKKVYVIKCVFLEGEGVAEYGGDDILLGLNSFSIHLIHELGHAVGSLYDEYVLDTDEKIKQFFNVTDPTEIERIRNKLREAAEERYRKNGPKNCVKDKCPDWWKDYGAECIEGCNGVSKGFFRDAPRDIMNSPPGDYFGPIDKYYLYKALGLDTEKLKVRK